MSTVSAGEAVDLFLAEKREGRRSVQTLRSCQGFVGRLSRPVVPALSAS